MVEPRKPQGPLDPTLAPYGWMLLGSLSFTFMSRWTHELGTACTWQVAALARSIMAFGFSATLAYFAGARLVFWRPRILWLRSLAGSGSLVCTFYATAHMPAAETLTITNTSPIWIALLAWPLDGQRPAGAVWLSVLGGVLGVALIKSPGFQAGTAEVWPLLVALVAAFFTAVAMMGMNRIRGVEPLAIVAHFSGVAVFFCCLSFLFFPFETFPETAASPPIAWLILGVGLTATLGQFCLTKAFSTGDATTVALVGLSQVVFALTLDERVWRGELHALTLLGIVLIIVPTGWVILSRRRIMRKTEPKA